MEETPRPTIKGVFVKAHIRALERDYGAGAVADLAMRMGHPLAYQNGDDVPIHDEVVLLEHIVDITAPEPLSNRERELEAGRLHFRNFQTTPLFTIVDSLLGSSPKFMLMQSSKIAGYVFQDVQFVSEDLGPCAVRLTMFNNEYPLEHFQGFFEAWLAYAALHGTVEAKADGRSRYEYVIQWKQSP